MPNSKKTMLDQVADHARTIEIKPGFCPCYLSAMDGTINDEDPFWKYNATPSARNAGHRSHELYIVAEESLGA